MKRSDTPRLSLMLQRAVRRPGIPPVARFRRWAQAALAQDVDVTFRIVGEAEGRELNRQYRGKDYATNVLTFVYDEVVGAGAAEDQAAVLSGDVVLCAPVVEREAQEQGKALEAHYAHLTIHGMLHLQGYDHEEPDEADQMEALESRLLTALGFQDPYAFKGDA